MDARKQPARLHDEDEEQVPRFDQIPDEVWLFLLDEGLETAHVRVAAGRFARLAKGFHATGVVAPDFFYYILGFGHFMIHRH